jgi:threonine synthase
LKYLSTRGGDSAGIDQALVKGIAKDGGLFLPEKLPAFSVDDFSAASTIQEVADILLRPFFAGSTLSGDIVDIIAETYAFPIPLTPISSASGRATLLELYHGPTAAFKDIGARFLAACLTRLEGDENSPLTILVATSGDTGGAVAAAFDEQPGMRVVVLFPDGRVSQRQAHQLTCWSDNVLSLCVQGEFDDCQALVKEAMADQSLASRYRFSSANSINIGRLLPQVVYYCWASLQFEIPASFVIPTGNLGNALACVWAREIGFPIDRIALATNANRTLDDYYSSGEYRPRSSVATLANAMDVGDPSNMERLRATYRSHDEFSRKLTVDRVEDDAIREVIAKGESRWSRVFDPHTACAMHVREAFDGGPWVVVATAHPAKFETIVEPLVGHSIELPQALSECLARPTSNVIIDASEAALRTVRKG